MHLPRAFRHAGRFSAALFFLIVSLAVVPVTSAFAASSTMGEQKTAVILVNFQDDASQPISRADAHALVLGAASDFYWEASYQQTFLSGETYGWYTVPVSKNVCDSNLVAQEADKIATAAGVDLSTYARLIYLMPDNACTAAGYNSGPTLPSRMWVNSNNFYLQIITHELGHNFGLYHSQSIDCGANVLGGDCLIRSYGDPADTMGSGTATHFNAAQKEVLGWINAGSSITTVSTSGSYGIGPFETTGTAAKALKIPRGMDTGSGEMSYYYIEYRQPIGFDAALGGIGNLTRGVMVHTGGLEQFNTLLDMTPDSYPTSNFNDMRDAALIVGRSYVDSTAGVTITLKSADTSGAVIEVSLSGSTAPPNMCTRAAPTLGLSGPTESIAAGSTVNYTLSLSNQDSSACAATSFNLAESVPGGWTGTLGAASLALSPGTSASTTLSVTSPGSATAGSYGIGVGAGSGVGSVHTANAVATYAVAAAAAGALTETVGTDKTVYLRGETIFMSARVLSNGTPVNGASVGFAITLPNGSATVLNATSGSDGYARATYKLGKGKNAIGSYQLRADARSGSATATASTGYSVR